MKGKVVRIVSDRQIALNVGKEHGVAHGMRFAIFAPSDQIVDPESGESLGEYRQHKATVTVTAVGDKFSLVGPIRRNPLLHNLLSGMSEGSVSGPDPVLPIDRAQVEPFPTGTEIRIGDVAEMLPSQQEQERQAEPEGDE
jgi:hypothetical protein